MSIIFYRDTLAHHQATKLLEHFGKRVQRSVFEISVVSQDDLRRLRKALLNYLEPFDDLRFYSLCRECRGKYQDAKGERVAVFPAAVVV